MGYAGVRFTVNAQYEVTNPRNIATIRLLAVTVPSGITHES